MVPWARPGLIAMNGDWAGGRVYGGGACFTDSC